MSIFPGDVRIKAAIEDGLDDIRKNDWLFQDIFSDFIEDPLLAKKYGQKEIDNAKQFIKNNEIPVIMGLRMDKEHVPCITIQVSPNQEADDLATLGDHSTEIMEYSPEQIGKPIKFIIPSFKIESYEKSTGIVTTKGVDLKYLNAQMVAVNPKNGNGYIVLEKLDENSFRIEPNLKMSCKELAIIPNYRIYRARRERATFRESYNIGCHAHGDPSTLIFLHSTIMYILLRYREGLLESKNFELSSISSSDMMKNQAFQSIQENVFTRFITLKGQAEYSWVKTPTRVIEAVDLKDGEGIYDSGIKIISKEKIVDEDDPLWVTINE